MKKNMDKIILHIRENIDMTRDVNYSQSAHAN